MDFELSEKINRCCKTPCRSLFKKITQLRTPQLRRFFKSEHGYSAEVWAQLAEQGVLGVAFPEAHGGFGEATEISVAMEQIGRGLVLEPFLSTVVLCGGLIRDNGSQAQQAQWLPKIIAGECRLAFAHHEQGARYALDYVNTKVTTTAGGYTLNGSKTVVLDGAVADAFIVSAKDVAVEKWLCFLVDANAAGLKRVSYRTHDGSNAADITLTNVQVASDRLLGKVGDGLMAIERAVDQSECSAVRRSCRRHRCD